MKQLTAFITFLLLGVSATSHAQFEPRTYSFTPTIGIYTFDHHQELKSSALAGLRISRHLTTRWAMEAVVQYVPTESKLKTGNNREVSGLLYHLDGLYHFPLGEKWAPFLAAGLGATTLDGNVTGAETNLLVNYGGGLKYFYSDQVAVRADIRQVLVDDESIEHNMVYTLGLEFSWGGSRKSASDASAAPEPVTSAGAPVVGDSDKDGVPDDRDLCADTPAGVAVNEKGCPLAVDGDEDGDGVSDSRDKCPGTLAGTPVDAQGCALNEDEDRDGVSDGRDRCPGTPMGTPVDENGCPVNQDSDGDGVPDGRDKCPDTPSGTAVDENGCPQVIAKKTTTESHIRFATGKTEIVPAFMGEVERIANYLNKFPETTIEIEGHTDNTGPRKLNDRLSLARAESLKKILVGRFGVEASRLKVQGYSWDRPIADNNTVEGREKNRRVVVTLSPADK